MNSIGELSENVAIIKEGFFRKKNTFGFGMDSKKFYAEVSFTHPIHDKNFLKLNTRADSNRNEITLGFNED